MILDGVEINGWSHNGVEINTWIHNGVEVYSSGRLVTYYIDEGLSYQEKIKKNATCLTPTTFTPSMTGWEFIGWREDTVASGTVLSSKVMGNEPITLYAVFRKKVTVTYYNNSATASATSKYRYYNNGNVTNPSFTLTQAAKSGWTARGWATGTTGDAIIVLKDGGTFERGSDYTLYGMYQQTITVSYAGNGSTSGSTVAQTGTRYYNSNGNVVNPKFTLSANGFAKTNYVFSKWALGSASGTQYAAGASVTLSASTTFYAVWKANVADKVLPTIPTVYVVDDEWQETGKSTVRYTFDTKVDRSLYSGVKLHIDYLVLEPAFSNSWMQLNLTDGSASTQIATVYNSGSESKNLDPVLNFNSSTGTATITLNTTGTDTVFELRVNYVTMTLIGRKG